MTYLIRRGWGALTVGLLFCFVTLANLNSARANFLFTNFSAIDAQNSAFGLAGFEASGAISVGFKVLAPITLTSVDFKLKANTGSSASKDATLVLRDNDNSGNPGNTLASFNTVAVGTTFQTATFAPTNTVNLTAGSTYWLTLGTTILAGGDLDGLVPGTRNPAVNPSGVGAEFVGLRFGTPAVQFSSPFFVDAPSIQISGISAVPEPSTTGLVVGLVTCMLWRRRKAMNHSGQSSSVL